MYIAVISIRAPEVLKDNNIFRDTILKIRFNIMAESIIYYVNV